MTAKRPAADDGARRVITDARTMRAVAHPVRLALLETLLREGELTATRAAELLDESPGNMSWHLQTLAKYGFVEEAEGGRGRSRPWRVVSRANRFDTAVGDAESTAAGDALEATSAARTFDRLQEWWSQRRGYSTKWRRAAFANDSITYLTADELAQLGNEITELFLRWRDRTHHKDRRPAGSLPVHLVAFAHPLPTTPSGN